MPAPVFQAAGTQQTGINSVNVSWPTHLANDIGLLVIECGGEGTTLTPPAGWAAIPSTPVTSVATTAGSKLHVWWKRAASSAEAAVATGDSGDHQVARIFTFRGCITTGDPWDVTTTGTKTTASTTATVPAVTTTLVDTRIVAIVGRPDDSASTTHFGTLVNANLTGIGEAGEAGTTSGHGGGFVVAHGVKATAGSTGTSTLTKAASTTDTYVVIALKQPPLAFTLTANTTSFALAGQAILVDQARTAGTTAVALSGGAATLSKGYQMTAASGAVSLAGGTALVDLLRTAATAPFALGAQQLLVKLKRSAATAAFSQAGGAATFPRQYRLAADSGTFAHAGGLAGLRAGRRLPLTAGAFNFSGSAAGLSKNSADVPMAVEPGSFALSGQQILVKLKRTAASAALFLGGSAILLRLKRTAANAAFTLGGGVTGLRASYRLTAASASTTSSGAAAGLRRGYVMPAASGGLLLGAQAAGLNRGRRLTTTAGTFAHSGQGFLVKLSRSAQSAPFALSGVPTAFKRGIRLLAANGSLSLGLGAAGLRIGLRFTAAGGAYNLAGGAVALPSARRLTGATGSFALSGSPAIAKRSIRMAAGSGGLALGGSAAVLTPGRGMSAASGGLACAGSDAGLRAARVLPLAPGATNLSGSSANLTYGRTLAAAGGTYAATGGAAGLSRGWTLLAATGTFTLVRPAATLRRQARLSAAAGPYLLTGSTGGLARAFTLLANTGAFTVSRKAAELRYLLTRPRLLDCLANGPDPTFTDRYGGSDNTSPAFVRPYYVQYNAVSKSRDLGSTEILEANLNGTVGTQGGTNTLYFKVTLSRDLAIRVERNSTGSSTDRYISVGVLDSNRVPVQMGADGYCYLNDIHNTSDDESQARMPAGTYYVTVSTNQWASIPYDIMVTIGRYAIAEGPALGSMLPSARLPLIKPVGVALATAPAAGTLLRPALVKKLASSAALGTATPVLSLAILRGVALGQMLPSARLKVTWRLSGSAGGSNTSTATLTSENDGGYGYGY